MNFDEKRRHPRKDVYIAALIALGENGYLSEVWDLSQGGARLGRPKRWSADPSARPVKVYFMLDQETVIAITARIVRVSDDNLGIEFVTGQEDRIQSLLYEARFLEQAAN
ncbi:MAG TPA: PilZ domain-containing protein [Xanthomonadales bacterium]|nr:PilZ domain-containing protein [Xanthomonadales bacterium]